MNDAKYVGSCIGCHRVRRRRSSGSENPVPSRLPSLRLARKELLGLENVFLSGGHAPQKDAGCSDSSALRRVAPNSRVTGAVPAGVGRSTRPVASAGDRRQKPRHDLDR
jgi:hypothetical protein